MQSTADTYNTFLNSAFQQANDLVQEPAKLNLFRQTDQMTMQLYTFSSGATVELGKTVSEAIGTIVGNLSQNKYLYSILITCLIEKAVHPTQDIRIAQT